MWISVTERLPGIDVRSLFVLRGKVVVGSIAPSDMGYRIYSGEEFDEAPLIWEFTHWMPMPEPPERGIQGGI